MDELETFPIILEDVKAYRSGSASLNYNKLRAGVTLEEYAQVAEVILKTSMPAAGGGETVVHIHLPFSAIPSILEAFLHYDEEEEEAGLHEEKAEIRAAISLVNLVCERYYGSDPRPQNFKNLRVVHSSGSNSDN